MEIDLPDGWEGRIFTRGVATTDRRLPSEEFPPVLHAANFGLPATMGDFGGGAVEAMGHGHVFVALIDYGSDAADTPLFSDRRVPRRLTTADFHPAALQRTLVGQSGVQKFFTAAERGFCLYVVLGAHLMRPRLVPLVNEAVRTLRIS